MIFLQQDLDLGKINRKIEMATVYELTSWHTNATTKVSDIIRALALSEIGIIWIFHKEIKECNSISYSLPKELVCPIILVIIGLTLDLLQYCWQSVITHYFYRKYEKKYPKRKDREEKEIPYAPRNNYFSYFMFYAKILVVIFSYVLLSIYLFELISKL